MCLLAVAATLIATVSVTPQTRALQLTGVNVVNVVDGRIIPNSTVTITGQTIANVAPHTAPLRGAQVVDGRGRFLIPGLWDMHAHMEASGESWLQLYVANGVTGIRDMGSDVDLILKMREATASGRMLGPRIFAAGPILDDAPGDWPFRMRVKTAEDGRSAVQLLTRQPGAVFRPPADRDARTQSPEERLDPRCLTAVDIRTHRKAGSPLKSPFGRRVKRASRRRLRLSKCLDRMRSRSQ